MKKAAIVLLAIALWSVLRFTGPPSPSVDQIEPIQHHETIARYVDSPGNTIVGDMTFGCGVSATSNTFTMCGNTIYGNSSSGIYVSGSHQ